MVRWRIDGLAQQHDWSAAEPALPECLCAKSNSLEQRVTALAPCNSILRMRRELELFEADPIDKAQWSKPQPQPLLINAWWRTRTRALSTVQFGSCMRLWKPSMAASISPPCAIRGKAPVESDCILLEEDCEGGHPLPPPYNNPVSSNTYARVWQEAPGARLSEAHLALGEPTTPAAGIGPETSAYSARPAGDGRSQPDTAGHDRTAPDLRFRRSGAVSLRVAGAGFEPA